jgi:RNA polymerase sigma-70 factor (ECF subfamily)
VIPQSSHANEKYDPILFGPDVSERNREAAIWMSFKSGNKDAFNYVFNSYIKVLYAYGEKITKDKALVQDCIQDLFIELWKRKSALSDTDSIKYYLFKSLRRRIVRKLAGNFNFLRISKLTDDFNFAIEFSHENKLVNEQLAEDRKKIVAKSLEKLSNRQREAIYLKFYQKLSSQEIADTMEIDINSLYNLISKSIEILRASLKNSNNLYF